MKSWYKINCLLFFFCSETFARILLTCIETGKVVVNYQCRYAAHLAVLGWTVYSIIVEGSTFTVAVSEFCH